MAITLTGAKYTRNVTSYNNREITMNGANFQSGDFDTPRIVGIWNNGNYRGLSWVRRFVSASVLEMEFNFIDKDGNEITPNSGDTALVSLNYADVVQAGITLNNNIVTQTDNIIIGNNDDSDSICFYDENKQINITNDANTFPYQFRGGLFVMGHLINYNDRSFFNSVDLVSSDGGSSGNQLNVSNLSAKVWWLGGNINFAVTPARFPGGGSGTPAEWQKWWGIETNGDIATPGGGAPWSSNAENQQFINCTSLIASTNAIGFRVADSDLQGGLVKISGGTTISPFGADAASTYVIGAPADQRFTILDMGTNPSKTAFWRSSGNTAQTIIANNVISTDFRFGRTSSPGGTPNTLANATINFVDTYKRAKATTKIVINESNNGVEAAAATSVSGEDIPLSVKYADVNGHTLTVNETQWGWGAIHYNENIVSGSFETSLVSVLSGDAINVSHGSNILQSTDLDITQLNYNTALNYNTTNTNERIYDHLKALLYRDYEGENQTIALINGNFRNRNIVVNNGTGEAIITPTQVTLFASSLQGVRLTTTGSITVADGIDITGATFSSLNLNSGRNLQNVIVNGTLIFNDNNANTFDLINSNINTLVNDGTGLLTFSNSGSTVSNSSDAQINIVIAPTPSTMNLTTTGRWAIYDNSGSFVESGSGNKTYNNIGTDTGTWTVIVHRLGYQAEKFAWVSDNDTINDFAYSDTQVIRPEGGQAYSGSATPSVSTSTSGDKILTLIGNIKVESQQVLDSIQDYLNTDSGLDWLHTYENLLSPTWGVLSGISYYLNVEGFVYDSTAGSTPESGVGGLIVSSASHLNVLTTNGGTIFASAVEDEIIDQATFHAYLDAYANKDDWKATGAGGGGSYDDTALIAKVDLIDANVNAILSDTNELQTNQGDWVTATGFATPANITDSETAIITEINTNETKIDTINTVVDAIKAKTDTLENTDLTGVALESSVQSIKAKTDTLVNTDLTGIATTTNVTDARDSVITEINANETKIDSLQTSVNNLSFDDSTILNAINSLNDISTADIRTELAAELARLDVSVSSVAYNDTALTNLVNALPTLAQMEASTALTAIADITGLSTHDAAAVVTAMQVVANDFKADVSGISFDDTAILNAISSLNDLSIADVEGSNLAKEASLTSIVSSIAAIPTTDSVADLTPVLTAISNLNDVSPSEVRAAFNAVDFKDKNTELEMHAWLDSYANKNSFKADISSLATSAEIMALNNISASDVWAVASRTLTEKTGFTLDSAEYISIANSVQAAIINEGDGQQVIDAIVQAIGNSNIDEIALVAAIRADIERNGGMMDNIPTLNEIESSSILAKEDSVQLSIAVSV